MPEIAVPDPTDLGTLRPLAEPLNKKGAQFKPMEIDDFDFEVHLPESCSPDDPITLFTQYYNEDMIDTIVSATNSYQPALEPYELKPQSRFKDWYNTCRSEIYLYLAVCIYMTVYPLNRIEDYWSTNPLTPFHPISKAIERNQFQALRRRFRVSNEEDIHLFQRVIPPPIF
jgi:hypothetical protein